jgi:alpha-L-arabinofuranosidase
MTAHKATVTLDAAYRIAPVPPLLFGTFVEHMGRCVYGGIYEPEHPSSDEYGFRQDVADLARELGVTAVRYPGGNFVSGYDWRDGIGPRDQRPARIDRAWKAIETNHVGTDDFLRWAERVGLKPIMAVNLGTGGVQDACDLLEYCNFPSGTKWADLRISNGSEKPYDVRMWCLGNEMDGPWQIGHKTAEEYGRIAAEAARAMHRMDPTIELTICGSSNSGMPTFGEWEATVLRHTYDLVDRISLHAYYEQHDDDAASFLASAVDMDAMIRAVVATADAEGARRRSDKKIRLAFDEWNVWYQARFDGGDSLAYDRAPNLIEDTYSRRDAVVVADLLMTLLGHSDRVDMACQAQLVNVIAPIRTEPGGPAWRQSIFDPFALIARHARGEVLRPAVSAESHETKRYGDVELLSVAATHDRDAGEIVLMMVNRSVDQDADVHIHLRDLPNSQIHTSVGLQGRPEDTNNLDRAAVSAEPIPFGLHDGIVQGRLAPESWALIRVI